VKNALLALLQGPSEWYAAQLRSATNGSEVNDKTICRILGSHDKEEVKGIADAFERKYNESLKRVLTSKCKGNYKRLAVAWVDLPDQLAQPQKTIEIPTSAAVAEEEGSIRLNAALDAQTQLDNEISEDDEAFDEAEVAHTSPLYRAKVTMWTEKYQKYNAMGKARKADHYQRLLLANPPTTKGDDLLRNFHTALVEEYKKDATGDDWTGLWLGSVEDAKFTAAGTSRDFFKTWFDVTESMVREKRVGVQELEGHWGLRNKVPMATNVQPVYAQPVPLTPYATPMMPIAQPMMPVAQPMMPMAQPMVMHPVPNMVAQPMFQPAMPMNACSTTTTTTTTSSVMYGGMPALQPAPMIAVYR